MSDTHRLPDGRVVVGAWMDYASLNIPMVWVCVYSHQDGYSLESLTYAETPPSLLMFGSAFSSLGRTLSKLAAVELAKRFGGA